MASPKASADEAMEPSPNKPKRPNKNAHLAALPEELTSSISIKLGSDDIFAFRLTCKALETKSFHEFATEYFSEKCFQFTTDSLRVLVEIAKSVKLRGYLKEVFFITTFFHQRAFACPNGSACAWQPTVRQAEAYRLYVKDQQQLKDDGEDRAMLTEAFGRLNEVHTLLLIDNIDYIKASTDYRGGNKVSRTTNTLPVLAPLGTMDGEFHAFQSHIWKTMIKAIAYSELDTIRRFGTSLTRNAGSGLRSFDMDFDASTYTSLAKTLHKVSHVQLQLNGGLTRDTGDDFQIHSQGAAEAIQTFAATLSSAKRLLLEFGSNLRFSSLQCNAVMSAVDSSKLTNFVVKNLVIDAAPLGKMVANMTSVKELHLTSIDLTDGDWVSILKIIRKLHTLNHLHLMYLSEGGRHAYFLPQLTDEELDALDATFNPLDILYGAPGTTDDAETQGSDGASDRVPDLEPQSPVAQDVSETLAAEAVPALAAEPSDVEKGLHEHSTAHYTALGHEWPSERGYYICLQGEQIGKELPTFIKEYNLGDPIDAQLPAILLPNPGQAQAQAQPQGANANPLTTLLNSLTAALGTPTGAGGNAQAGFATFGVPPPAANAHGATTQGNNGQGAGGGLNAAPNVQHDGVAGAIGGADAEEDGWSDSEEDEDETCEDDEDDEDEDGDDEDDEDNESQDGEDDDL